MKAYTRFLYRCVYMFAWCRRVVRVRCWLNAISFHDGSVNEVQRLHRRATGRSSWKYVRQTVFKECEWKLVWTPLLIRWRAHCRCWCISSSCCSCEHIIPFLWFTIFEKSTYLVTMQQNERNLRFHHLFDELELFHLKKALPWHRSSNLRNLDHFDQILYCFIRSLYSCSHHYQPLLPLVSHHIALK